MVEIKPAPYLNPYLVNGKQLANIIFYNEGGVVLDTDSSWFRDYNLGDIKKVFLEVDEVKNRRKVNFSRNEVFLVGHVLYIPAELVNLTWIEEKEYDRGANNVYYDVFKFNVWSETRLASINEITIHKYVGSRQTDFGAKVEQVKKQLEEDKINIESYYLEKLLEKYDLVKKEIA